MTTCWRQVVAAWNIGKRNAQVPYQPFYTHEQLCRLWCLWLQVHCRFCNPAARIAYNQSPYYMHETILVKLPDDTHVLFYLRCLDLAEYQDCKPFHSPRQVVALQLHDLCLPHHLYRGIYMSKQMQRHTYGMLMPRTWIRTYENPIDSMSNAEPVFNLACSSVASHIFVFSGV